MAITITAAAKAPANANANANGAAQTSASADSALQSAGGVDLFASLLDVQLDPLGSLGNAGVKADTVQHTAAKAAKSDKPEQTSTTVDPSMLAYLQGAGVPVSVTPSPQAGNTAQGSSNEQAATDAALQVDDTSSQLGGALKKAGALQKLPPDDAANAQFLPLTQTVASNTGNVDRSNGTTATVVLTVPTPMQDPNWGKAFGEQMLGMVSLKADTAHIQVNPPQLGPIDVSLKIDNNNQAQVTFVTSNPMAREVVENNLNRLSHMLQASGIQLTGAQVSTGQGNQQQAFAQQQQQRNRLTGQDDEPDLLAGIIAARGVLSIA
jgi:flagellar hook-length control protein FliK